MRVLAFARLDFQPLWESGFLSSSQLRLDHWSVARVRDVTSAFNANYYAGQQRGEKMAEFVAMHKIKPKPVSKDNALDSSG